MDICLQYFATTDSATEPLGFTLFSPTDNPRGSKELNLFYNLRKAKLQEVK